MGLLTVGFETPRTNQRLFETRHQKMNEDIIRSGEYSRVGLNRIHLDDIDGQFPFAWVGVWARSGT